MGDAGTPSARKTLSVWPSWTDGLSWIREGLLATSLEKDWRSFYCVASIRSITSKAKCTEYHPNKAREAAATTVLNSTYLMNLPRRQLIQLPLRKRMRTQTRPWPSSLTPLRPIVRQPATLIRVSIVQIRTEDVRAQRTQDDTGEEPSPQVVGQAAGAVAQVGPVVEHCGVDEGQKAAADNSAGEYGCHEEVFPIGETILLQEGRGPFLPVAGGRDLA
ncbi:hypothetical protein VTN77DRAFT_3224 [Rasamsonia byssochlamydoides]|uniref:uncharacterized protein n=1 Tax=Rasamsonia byssochlamydoides TaxID=89139 RepID=UPI003743EBE5